MRFRKHGAIGVGIWPSGHSFIAGMPPAFILVHDQLPPVQMDSSQSGQLGFTELQMPPDIDAGNDCGMEEPDDETLVLGDVARGVTVDADAVRDEEEAVEETDGTGGVDANTGHSPLPLLV